MYKFNSKQLTYSLITLILIVFSFLGFKKIEMFEPNISLDDYTIEEGFDLKVIASENYIKAPVAMDFDNKGRMWVVEMTGYMPNLEGIGEEEPTGKIKILEDLDKDGVIDRSKVFLDKLVLPRALAFIYGGLMYVDGPKLWFVEIKNDQPGKKTLVDPIYAEGGNVEHASNGLMMNIDNWIYNADYNFRYRLQNGKWLKEPTSMRGQWGITKDNFGRLYFNNNSTHLQGDFVLPNRVIKNKYFRPKAAENQMLTDNKVFPIHATSVNRGYVKNVLDENGFLKEVTASCGPVIYRGSSFPASYNQNAFVCVPEANLITRSILDVKTTSIKGTRAIPGKEFISSKDEGFRPVNLFNGPDGAMYIVDMHRGIIQHKAYISQYLTELLAKKQLDTLQNAGRILKVTHKNAKAYEIPDFTKTTSKDLVNLLSHPNGWIRDRAQQLLILRKDLTIVKDLKTLTLASNEYSTEIHALYVLEGLNALTFGFLEETAKKSKQPETVAHALGLLEKYAITANVPKFKQLVVLLQAQNNETIDLYLASSLGSWIKISENNFLPILSEIEKKYSTDKVFQDALTSSLEGKETVFMDKMTPNELLKTNLNLAITNKQKKEPNPIFVKVKNEVDGRTKGLQLFRSICATCHGADGKGIENLAPPLKGSEYIDGSTKRLAAIILHGIGGPMSVGGKRYELNNEMPALLNNSSISDQDIVDIIGFTQNAYAKEPKRITVADVKKMRSKKPEGSGVFNEKLLLETDFEK
ncbi:dehydrogenase [Lacihabitans soyangensis]|uniref:Dehydrogenase n=2 Tax=Lacihabitans soyangensis TaxID=869394 RepID=A0AAE3GYT8_9BACT|nr:dehydrogenase [Lacihabitans soyangensis]